MCIPLDVLERLLLEDRKRAWIQRTPGADRLIHRSNPRICGGRSTVLGKRRTFKLPVKPASVRFNMTNLTLDAQPHPTLRIRRKRSPFGPWLVVAVIRVQTPRIIRDCRIVTWYQKSHSNLRLLGRNALDEAFSLNTLLSSTEFCPTMFKSKD